MMDDNPYSSPVATPAAALDETQQQRRKALWQVRLSLVILMLVGAGNFYCFYYVHPVRATEPERLLRNPIIDIFAIINGFFLAVLFVAVWFSGLWLLERIALTIRLLSRGASRQLWLAALHRRINRCLAVSSLAGGAVWAAWIALFYLTPAPVLVIHNVAAVFAWGIVIWLLAPVFYRWWLLRNGQMKTAA